MAIVQNHGSILVGFLSLTIAACSSPVSNNRVADKSPTVAENPTVSDFLFDPAAFPKLPLNDKAGNEPIVVPLCHLTVIDKLDVSSNVDGTILWLGIPAKMGEKLDPKDSLKHRGVTYRRLRLGDPVEENQVLVLLDDRQAFVEMETAEKNVEAGKDEAIESEKALVSIREVRKIEQAAEHKGVSSPQLLNTAKTNEAKMAADHAKTKGSVKQKEGEFDRAKIKWEQHFLRTAIPGEVAHIIKQTGEGVKAAETVLQIQNVDRLRVEGYLDLQYERRVQVGTKVFIEPTVLAAPYQRRSFHSGKPVTAVAVATLQRETWIITGGEDGFVNVWNRKNDVAGMVWKHGRPVRALACTRPGVADPRVVTGCDDGKARVYDLAALTKNPLRILEGNHEGGVQAVAIAPDGSKCITADDRGDIFLWNLSTGKRIYRFPHEHNSSVSALYFTPQCRAVSVGRDNVVNVWKMGSKTAEVEQSFEHRTGDVGQLGVSDDGAYLLLDQHKDRLNRIELGEGRTVGTVQQLGDGAKFSTFALFSPAMGKNGRDRVVLTAGSSDGVLQLWRQVPGSFGRSSELCKLVCDGYVAATAAAFSPIAEDGCIVVGTKKGDVLVWPMTTEEELDRRYPAKVTHVDRTIESSGKSVRLFAELENPTDATRRLRPGNTATLVIPQE